VSFCKGGEFGGGSHQRQNGLSLNFGMPQSFDEKSKVEKIYRYFSKINRRC
jgi:hypothetical protein